MFILAEEELNRKVNSFRRGKVEGLLEDLKKNFDKEEPKERELLYPKDFQ